jgi:hypothetical protein
VTLTFEGPEESESPPPGGAAEDLNPFLDYRLEVTFTHASGGRAYRVPGHFAADGNAAETGASSGRSWRVHFMPDAAGEWRWRVSFRKGRGIAVAGGAGDGEPLAPDGAGGSFAVLPSDKEGRDFRAPAHGRLDHGGERYLRFAGSGKRFLKGGADSPENFLAYVDFDGTKPAPGSAKRSGEARRRGLHRYEPHAGDWRPGDPLWRGGRGKNVVGALNYLASKGMNSVYFLTMNVGGDGQDVWPWVSETERLAYDVSKLDQWELVFSHLTRLGLLLHVILTETENCRLLDGGELGPERKLYYRELISRFGHHPALVWNLGEENDNTDAERKAYAVWIKEHDPYRHPVVVHTFPPQKEKVYGPLLGFPHLDGASLQVADSKETHAETVRWIERSVAAARPWFVCLDEIGPAPIGVKPDADDPDRLEIRWRCLWANLLAGGAGVEWYFGYQFAHNDLDCEDWRSRDALWDQTRFALEFFHRHLPFWEMRHQDGLVSPAESFCFAKRGEVYAVYLPRGGEASLDLAGAEGAFRILWYDPRKGGELQQGSAREAGAPGKVSLGLPPEERARDWVVLIRR